MVLPPLRPSAPNGTLTLSTLPLTVLPCSPPPARQTRRHFLQTRPSGGALAPPKCPAGAGRD